MKNIGEDDAESALKLNKIEQNAATMWEFCNLILSPKYEKLGLKLRLTFLSKIIIRPCTGTGIA